MKKLYEITVEGRSTFPFDMLRYDACWPTDQESVSRLDSKSERSIKLSSHSPFTEGRWNSFGWRVTRTAERRV